MTENFPVNDRESDRLVSIMIDENVSPIEKRRASTQLYTRHSDWVLQRIGLQIYEPELVQDIAQAVWIAVLDCKVLEREYVDPKGKFRAYLHNPIRWAISKHIAKLPYTRTETGEKQFVAFVSHDDERDGFSPNDIPRIEGTLTAHRIDQMIEKVIKPNLIHLSLKVRNVFMLDEHDLLFDRSPTTSEIATINAITQEDVLALLQSSSAKSTNECDDSELSVHIPVNYDSIIDRTQLHRNSTMYLSGVIGITSAAYRKRLHEARQYLSQAVRDKMLPDEYEGHNHG